VQVAPRLLDRRVGHLPVGHHGAPAEAGKADLCCRTAQADGGHREHKPADDGGRRTAPGGLHGPISPDRIP